MWSTAISGGLEQFAESIPGTPALNRRSQADAIDLSTFPVLGGVRIELATMLLLERRGTARADVPPALIVAPFAFTTPPSPISLLDTAWRRFWPKPVRVSSL